MLTNLSKESYLKDKGAAYRYTQAFKLQVELLENLATFSIHLDMNDKEIELIMEAVFLYLSDKQPLPLQVILAIL